MNSEPGTRRTALLVDDDPRTRAVLRHVLEIEGWRVLEAEDGREALASHATSPADVVITDVEMPVMGGVELAERLQDVDGAVPVLAVTRNPPSGDDVDVFDGVLRKPVSLPDLRDWLARH